MYLTRVKLRNWKLYGGDHEFSFPEPGRRQNVVLIGAKNGYGKTSLLEAIILGLYGADGLDIVPRADAGGDDNRRRLSYRKFIQEARHQLAGRTESDDAEVELQFIDPNDGRAITIRRTWRFGINGHLLGDGEQVHIEVDGARKIPGRNDDPADFARRWVAQAALPSHLAHFFLFDGERVQSLANREMAAQVRVGIEGFLGVRLMRDLADDLGSYATKTRTEVPAAEDSALFELRAELERIDRELSTLHAEEVEHERALEAATRESEQLQTRLASMGGGSAKNVQRLMDQRGAVEREQRQRTTELTELVGTDFALALTGSRIRQQVRLRLQGEQKLASSLAAIESSRGRIGRFIAALRAAEPAFQPELSQAQDAALAQKIGAAWTSIWHPPEDGCATEFRHAALTEHDRPRIIERLDQAEQLGEDSLATLLDKIRDADIEMKRLQSQINTYAGIESELEELSKQLTETSNTAGRYAEKLRDNERRRKALQDDRNQRYAALQQKQALIDRARPFVAKAEVAERLQAVIPKFIDAAVGERVDEIARHMTRAFREMAHKSHVEEITIDKDCNVRLLNKRGDDLRTLDQSAGENQIFAFALISAIAQAADVRFPIVIDTPLARLDAAHRTRVLRHFAANAGEQIIFLSQDTEIVGEFKDAIATKIKKTYRIEHEAVPGSASGRAVVREHDYF